MPSRAAVYSLLDDDAELKGVNIGIQAVLASNSIDSPTERFFVVIRWEESVKAFKNKGANRLTVWVHTRDGDYTLVDKALERIKDLLTSTIHRAGADGWTMTLAEWNSDSTDLIDGGFGTLTRNSDYTVVSRYTMA